MKKLLAVAMLSAALLTTACATGYHPAEYGPLGYSEVRLAPDRWTVTVNANSNTTAKEAEQILMRRAAELTLERGKRYFVLTGHDQWKRRIYYPSGINYAPSNEATVSAVATKEEDAFDAVEIIAETNEYAEGRLSDAARSNLNKFMGTGDQSSLTAAGNR